MTTDSTQFQNKKLTAAAARVLRNSIWDTTVQCFFDYANPNRVDKSTLTAKQCIKALKATGGMIGIGWYSECTERLAEYTLWDAVSTVDLELRRILFDPNAIKSTYGTRADYESLPVTTPTDTEYMKKKLSDDSMHAVCLTVDEIKSHIGIDNHDVFPLTLSPRHPHTVFDSQFTQGTDWREITEFTPVTDPAREVINRMPWCGVKDEFLSYGAAHNPDDFIPNAENWVRLLKMTGGQVRIGWFSHSLNEIPMVTYYDLQSTETESVKKASLMKFVHEASDTQSTNTYGIKKTIGNGDLSPMCISIHSSSFHDRHSSSFHDRITNQILE